MVVDGAQHAAVRLPTAPDSISTARGLVRRALLAWDLEHLVDTATLLVSELATNVLLHAGTEFEVRVEHLDDRVRVAVLDGSARAPARRRYGLDAGTGRGLGLVETLSQSWGADTTDLPGAPGDGSWRKAVWFVLLTDPAVHVEDGEGALYGEDWLALVDEL